jgi:hypothetical protein
MTLLSMVQDACALISLPAPASAVGNTDAAIRILLSCAQREAKQLARRWTWQRLARRATFVSLNQQTQTNAIPADFDGRILSDTMWNVSRSRGVRGPLDPAEWQQRISSVSQGPYDAFRLVGDAILMSPKPIAGDTYSFEYMTRNVCRSALGVEQAAWVADTDVPILDDELMLLGLVWRFKQSRGMDYAEDMRTYEIEVVQAMSRDGARRTGSLIGDEDWSRPRYPSGVVITVLP